MASPGFDANRHRCAAGPDELAIAADFVADKDRLMKHHAVDGYRRAPSARPPRRKTAAGEIHLREQPPTEYVAVGLASAGMAKTLTSGSVRGNSTSDPIPIRLDAMRRDIA